jgi:hypothetical protein
MPAIAVRAFVELARSIRSPCYVSRTIKRDALATETDSPAHS